MSLLTSLVAYYSLQGNSNDATGNGNNGTDTSISYSTSYGKIAQGALFARSNPSKIVVGTASALQPASALTFSLWIKINNMPVSYCDIGGDTLSGFARGYSLDMDTSNISFRIGASSAWASVNTPVPSTGIWTHIVGTWDGSTVTLYKNGSSAGTVSKTSIDYSSSGFSLGNYYSDTTAANMLDGDIDEVGIWSRALTSTEVTQLYNGGAGLAYPLTPPAPANGNFFAFF